MLIISLPTHTLVIWLAQYRSTVHSHYQQTDGSGTITWADLAAVTFSDTAPSSPASGDLWFDSGTSAELFIWTGTEWISTTGGDQAAFTFKEYVGDNSTVAFNTGAGSNVRAFVYLNGILLKPGNATRCCIVF